MPEWTRNRVVLGLALFFLAMAAWEYRKPRFRPIYEQGIVLYQHQRYGEALRAFERAYAVAPNQVEVILMTGWSNLKLRRYEEARFYFQRAQKIDGRNGEAQLGAVLVDWQSGRRLDARKVERLAARYPEDADVQAMVEAMKRQGARE